MARDVNAWMFRVFLAVIAGLATSGGHLPAQAGMGPCIDPVKGLPLRKCASVLAPERRAQLSATREYSLVELVSIAEATNPSTREAWERAVARAATLSVERSALFPSLSFNVTAGDLRAINPFPKPLAPRGYTVVEIPSVAPGFELKYLAIDFGRRGELIHQASFEALASTFDFMQEDQNVVFQVAQSFFRVQAAEELLRAAEQSVKTVQSTEQAAEAQLHAGRATLPDLLQARAEAAQAEYRLQSAEGDVSLAKVALTQAVGAEPSPDIHIHDTGSRQAPEFVVESSQALIERAISSRPDLKAEAERLGGSEAKIREARTAYLPEVTVEAAGAQTAEWPTSDYGQLGAANVSTWNVSAHLKWEVFDGGRRSAALAQDRALARGQAAAVRRKKDAVEAEVWAAYFSLLTVAKQQSAAQQLFQAAQSSYDAALQAFQLGVKNIIDVVTAERSLADARSTQAVARANVMAAAVQIEFSTGNILSGSSLGRGFGSRRRKMTARARLWCALSILVTLGGCHRAPEVDLLGSFFPAWVLCCFIALPVAGIVRWLLIRADLEDHVGPLVIFYSCVGLASATSIWLLFFR